MLRYAYQKYGVLTQGFPESYMLNFDAHTYEIMYGAGVEMRDLTPEFCAEIRSLGVDPWGVCADTDGHVYQAILPACP